MAYVLIDLCVHPSGTESTKLPMKTMSDSNLKRSRILIDPQVQWSLALRVLLHWGMLVVCLLMVNTVITLLMMAGQRPLTGALGDAMRDQVPLLLVLLVLVPVFVRDTMKMSNRFAGPMYRIRTGLTALNRGEKTKPIKLRDRDFWQPVADDFNGVLKQVEELKAENEKIRATARNESVSV